MRLSSQTSSDLPLPGLPANDVEICMSSTMCSLTTQACGPSKNDVDTYVNSTTCSPTTEVCGPPYLEIGDDCLKTCTKDEGEKLNFDIQVLEPKEGMEFETIDDAKSFYNNYARLAGFGVTTADTKSKHGVYVFKKFSCHRCGESRRRPNAKTHRDTPKIGCKASVKVRQQKDTKKYRLYDVIIQHNHTLNPTAAVYLRSHRKINTPKKAEIVNMQNFGISTNIVSCTAQRKDGTKQLQFTENCKNFLERKQQTQLKECNAKMILTHFQEMQLKNPTFFYATDINDNGTLRNAFWIDGRLRTACTYFSDVIYFDTTYLISTYHMPFAPFVGVNHHGQSIPLGCALLSNEKIDSFKWLFNSWLQANGGVHPKVIITDHDKAIEVATVEVFPNAKHCFSLLHILKKIPEKIGHIHSANPNFMVDFDECIYDSISTDEFEDRWDKLMTKSESAKENEWLKGLYECRAKWAPVFLKDTFFAGMLTSQRSESISHFFDGFVTTKTTLFEFIEKYALELERMYDVEDQADVRSSDTEAYLKTSSPYEKQAADIYTRAVFHNFQHELIEVAACQPKIQEFAEDKFVFKVNSFERQSLKGYTKTIEKEYTVTLNKKEQKVQCTCRCFEFKGYLCRHVIICFQFCGIQHIPQQYFLRRWMKDMCYRHVSQEYKNDVDATSSSGRYTNLIYRFMKVAEFASKSVAAYDVAMTEIPNMLAKVMETIHGNKVITTVHSEPTLPHDPLMAATKGRKCEKRMPSALEKLRKKSKPSRRTEVGQLGEHSHMPTALPLTFTTRTTNNSSTEE